MLNTFIRVSALALTFVLLLHDERHTIRQPGAFAGTLTKMMQQAAVDTSNDCRLISSAK